MATAANTSMDSMPPLPSKHTSQRSSNLTPSPGPYDQPRPPGQPPSPLVGQAPISMFPQPYSLPQPGSRSNSQAGSKPPSLTGSRASTPTGANQYASIQPYPQPYGSSEPGTPTSPSPMIHPTMQPYPGMQSITPSEQQTYPTQSYSQQATAYGQQPYSSPDPVPPPSKKKMDGGRPERNPTWLVLSICTIFINPIFGVIALCFSLMSIAARTKQKRKNYGQIAKHCCIMGIGISVILGIVAAIIIGTNNRGYRKDQPEAP